MSLDLASSHICSISFHLSQYYSHSLGSLQFPLEDNLRLRLPASPAQHVMPMTGVTGDDSHQGEVTTSAHSPCDQSTEPGKHLRLPRLCQVVNSSRRLPWRRFVSPPLLSTLSLIANRHFPSPSVRPRPTGGGQGNLARGGGDPPGQRRVGDPGVRGCL